MRWERILGPERAEQLGVAVLAALEDAYDENCRRHAPEDLGDNNVTFGVNVSQNLRFLLERAAQAIPGVEIIRPRGSFALLIDHRYELYFYKAPPGVCDVRSLRFDASKTQLELVQANADQLEFDFEPLPDSSIPELTHLACIHFGDPLEGLHRADVGAPVSSPLDGLRWEWVECLNDGTVVIGDVDTDAAPAADDEEDEGFDLRLRDQRADDSNMSGESPG